MKRFLKTLTAVVALVAGFTIIMPGPAANAIISGAAITAAVSKVLNFLGTMQSKLMGQQTDLFGGMYENQTSQTEHTVHAQERNMQTNLEIANGQALQAVDLENERMQREAISQFNATLDSCRRITAQLLLERSGQKEQENNNRRKAVIQDIATGESDVFDSTQGSAEVYKANEVRAYADRSDALKNATENGTLLTGAIFEGVSEQELDAAIQSTSIIAAGAAPPLVDPNDTAAVNKRAEAALRWSIRSQTISEIAGENSSVDGSSVFQVLMSDVESASSSEELKELESKLSIRELLEDVARSARIRNKINFYSLKELRRLSLMTAINSASSDISSQAATELSNNKGIVDDLEN